MATHHHTASHSHVPHHSASSNASHHSASSNASHHGSGMHRGGLHHGGGGHSGVKMLVHRAEHMLHHAENVISHSGASADFHAHINNHGGQVKGQISWHWGGH